MYINVELFNLIYYMFFYIVFLNSNDFLIFLLSYFMNIFFFVVLY